MVTANSEAFLRIGINVAVPAYIKLAWDKKVPRGKRSAVMTSLLCDFLGLPEPVLEERSAYRKE